MDDAVIQYVQTILTKCYAAAARLEVSHLMGEGKFMVTEDWHSVKGHPKVAAMLQIDSMEAWMNVESDDEMDDGISSQSEESTNVITVHQEIYTCEKWQDHKYPCQHAMAYFQKWKNISFKEILQKHVHR